MWFDDADIQIVGLDIPNYEELNIDEKIKISFLKDDLTKFNESMRYKNVIKRQDKEIKQLKVDLLEEQLKNARLDLESKGESND